MAIYFDILKKPHHVDTNCNHLPFKSLLGSSMYSLIVDTVYDALEMLALLRAEGNFGILTTNRSMWPTILIRLAKQSHLLQFHKCGNLDVASVFIWVCVWDAFLSPTKIEKLCFCIHPYNDITNENQKHKGGEEFSCLKREMFSKSIFGKIWLFFFTIL